MTHQIGVVEGVCLEQQFVEVFQDEFVSLPWRPQAFVGVPEPPCLAAVPSDCRLKVEACFPQHDEVTADGLQARARLFSEFSDRHTFCFRCQ